jgi:hypothetical protein
MSQNLGDYILQVTSKCLRQPRSEPRIYEFYEGKDARAAQRSTK